MSEARTSHPNVLRVTGAARAAGLEIEVRQYPDGTRTAADAARSIGCDVAQIVKSLVFVADGRAVLALVGGDERLDTGKLARELGASEVRRAQANEARDATGYAIGGVPPLGHATPLPILIDEHLLAHREVWAAAGLPDVSFAAEPAALARAAGAQRADLAEER